LTRRVTAERSQLFGCPQSAVTRRTEAMLNLNELRVELLQSVSNTTGRVYAESKRLTRRVTAERSKRCAFRLSFNQIKQMLRCALSKVNPALSLQGGRRRPTRNLLLRKKKEADSSLRSE